MSNQNLSTEPDQLQDKTSIAENGDVWRHNKDSNTWTNYGNVEQFIYFKKGKK